MEPSKTLRELVDAYLSEDTTAPEPSPRRETNRETKARQTLVSHPPKSRPKSQPVRQTPEPPLPADMATLAAFLSVPRTERELILLTGWTLSRLWRSLCELIDGCALLCIHDNRPGRESRRFRLNRGRWEDWRAEGFPPVPVPPVLDVDEL